MIKGLKFFESHLKVTVEDVLQLIKGLILVMFQVLIIYDRISVSWNRFSKIVFSGFALFSGFSSQIKNVQINVL